MSLPGGPFWGRTPSRRTWLSHWDTWGRGAVTPAAAAATGGMFQTPCRLLNHPVFDGVDRDCQRERGTGGKCEYDQWISEDF